MAFATHMGLRECMPNQTQELTQQARFPKISSVSRYDIPGTIKICDDNDVMEFGKTQAE